MNKYKHYRQLTVNKSSESVYIVIRFKNWTNDKQAGKWMIQKFEMKRSKKVDGLSKLKVDG